MMRSRVARNAEPEARGERGPRIAFQGALGAFSEEAALRFFDTAEALACHAFTDVVDAVVQGKADYGALPVENTIHGCVTGSYDALTGAPVTVVAETVLPIRHCLMAPAGRSIEDVRRVISHPVALAQCGDYLARLEGVEVMAVYDTAGAADEVSCSATPGLAAVASRGAAHRYDLQVLASDIQDRDDNQTRFFLVGPATETDETVRPRSAGEELWKTALVAETPNRPGALHRLLAVFAHAGINLTQLQARPADTPWTYRFFLEYEHSSAAPTAAAIEAARAYCEQMTVLGTFPAAMS